MANEDKVIKARVFLASLLATDEVDEDTKRAFDTLDSETTVKIHQRTIAFVSTQINQEG